MILASVARRALWICLPWLGIAAGQVTARDLVAAFGRYEALFFESEILGPLDLAGKAGYSDAYFERAVAALPDLACLVVGHGSARELLPDELATLEAWLRGGGVLILTGREGATLFGKSPPAWTGRDSWLTESLLPTVQKIRVTDPAHPLVTGVDQGLIDGIDRLQLGLHGAARGHAVIGADSLAAVHQGMVREAPEVLAGEVADELDDDLTDGLEAAPAAAAPSGPLPEDGTALVWFCAVGTGRIVYLGGHLTPQGPPSFKQYQVTYATSGAGIQVWRNLIDWAGLPSRSDSIRRWASSESVTAPVTFWWRYDRDQPLGGAFSQPPHPVSDDELVRQCQFDVGAGERCWRQVFLTRTTGQAPLRFVPTPLRTAAGTELPATALSVLVQAAPGRFCEGMRDPPPRPGDYHKSSYWLVPPQDLPPLDEDAVTLAAPATHTVWVHLQSPAAAAPGTYEGSVEVYAADAKVAALPCRVVVWPLTQPGPQLLHFEYEHNWASMPGGYWLDPQRQNNELVAGCIRHVAALGIDFGQCYGRLHDHYGFQKLRTRDGRPLAEALEGRGPGDPLPGVDWSWFDETFFDAGATAGFSAFGANFADLDSLPVPTELHEWFLGEFVRYVHERGFPHVYCKTLDEIEANAIPALVARAGVLHRAGFRTYTTTPNFMFTADAVRQADAVLDLWQARYYTRPYPELAKELLGVELDPNDSFWAYGASSYPGLKGFDWARANGWIAAYARHPGYHFHHYFRWYQDERNAALPAPNGFFDGAVTVARIQGIFQARYLAALYRWLDLARTRDVAPGRLDEIAAAAEAIVGTTETALLRIGIRKEATATRQGQDNVFSYVPNEMKADPRVHEQAKVRIMQLLLALRELLPPVPREVRYGAYPLTGDGRWRLSISCPEAPELLTPLRDWATAVCGSSPPDADAAELPGTLVAGTLAGAPKLAAALSKQAPGQFTASYPAAGHYAIKCLPTVAQPQQIFIVGGDRAGIAKGLAAFRQFLIVENQW